MVRSAAAAAAAAAGDDDDEDGDTDAVAVAGRERRGVRLAALWAGLGVHGLPAG